MIPRPNHNDEIYKNPDKQPIYNTSEDSLPPHTNSFFIVNETQNSSPRLIRGTFSKIPQDSSILSASGLQFGLVVQPFAEFLPQEREIPKVESPDGIFRCKRCSSYINSKYSIDFDKMNKRIAVCNICSCHNELDSNNPTVKSDYFNNSANVPELCCPTVDFHAPSTMKHNFTFEPHYIFMIDVTQASIDCGVPAYVIILI